MATQPTADDDIVRILVATDNHLGYMEKDPVRSADSFESFEEIFKLAREKQVDFVLLGGDLFHENKPSRKSMFKAMEIFRKYCHGDRPVKLQFLSDPEASFHHPFGVNYENPHVNIDVPVFSIHGNHDDPAGDGQLAALDILCAANLVNYFGKSDKIDDITVYPLLFAKGKTKIALYGLGNIRDERLHRTFADKKVRLMRPIEDRNEWFNILVLHQNRVDRSSKNSIQEGMLDEFLDYVVWGHEHECKIMAEDTAHGFKISQPGSSVATSLIEGEAKRKHVGLLEIREDKFRLTPLPLQSVRPFLFEDVILQEHMADGATDNDVSDFLTQRVDSMIERARTEFESDKIPLIRLKVDYTGFSMCNAQRFGQRFVGRVANPSDILLFHRHRKSTTTKKVAGALTLPPKPEALDAVRIEDLIDDFLSNGADQQILHLGRLGEALQRFVEKDEKTAIQDFVDRTLKETQTYLKGQAENTSDAAAIEAIIQQRLQAEGPVVPKPKVRRRQRLGDVTDEEEPSAAPADQDLMVVDDANGSGEASREASPPPAPPAAKQRRTAAKRMTPILSSDESEAEPPAKVAKGRKAPAKKAATSVTAKTTRVRKPAAKKDQSQPQFTGKPTFVDEPESDNEESMATHFSKFTSATAATTETAGSKNSRAKRTRA